MMEAIESPRMRISHNRWLMVGVAFVALLLALTLTNARPAQAATYELDGYDYINVQTTHAGTWNNSPYIQWSRGQEAWYTPWIYRGEYKRTYVVAKQPVYCIYAKITWHTLTGNVSWPPSGSGSATSDGFLRSCRSSGQSYPTYLTLSGAAYAKSSLYASTLTVCHTTSSTAYKVCSQNKYWY